MANLLTATDIGDVRRLQGEIKAYQSLLDIQQKPQININPQ